MRTNYTGPMGWVLNRCKIPVPYPFRSICSVADAAYIWKKVQKRLKTIEPDILISCPQSPNDLTLTLMFSAKLGVPYVLWVMDDYFTGKAIQNVFSRVWCRAERRFVVSSEMATHLISLFGETATVLPNGVDYDELESRHSESSKFDQRPIRMVYAGTAAGYYSEAFTDLVFAVERLAGLVTLDAYILGGTPMATRHNLYTRILPAFHPNEIVMKMREYQISIVLSNFSTQWKRIANTSLASKIADNLSSSTCIIFYGPDYAANVRYAQRNSLGIVVKERGVEHLIDALRLAQEADVMSKHAKVSYEFGKKTHNRKYNSTILWRGIAESCPA